MGSVVARPSAHRPEPTEFEDHDPRKGDQTAGGNEVAGPPGNHQTGHDHGQDDDHQNHRGPTELPERRAHRNHSKPHRVKQARFTKEVIAVKIDVIPATQHLAGQTKGT